MGRGPVIQQRKNVVNAAKGKVFSIHAKLIAVAAQKGGNPDDNPSLATAMYKARKEGVPNDTIDRAIKKGTGEDKDADQIMEITYEGYAPGGVAVMVTTLTDNKNRTVSSIRHAFSKCGGNMGENWAVSWMFHRKGIIFIDPKKYAYEAVEEFTFETAAEDIISDDNYIKIVTSLEDFHDVEKAFEDKNIELMESKIDYIADNEVALDDFDKALQFKKMVEALEADEDVSQVSTNEILSEELSAEVDAFIEKNTFRS